MKTIRNRNQNVAFVDFFLILCIAFLLLINPPTKKADIEKKAEFIITMEWNAQAEDDVDLYLKDPSNRVVWFNDKRTNVAHLSRDDLGAQYDIIAMPDGSTKKIELNEEVITIRGIAPGRYTVNIHYYRKTTQEPLEVTVQIIKLNPFHIVNQKTVIIQHQKEEITITNFEVDPSGRVNHVDDLPEFFANKMLANRGP